MTIKARVISLYLPQYHPIPENNQWWGNGFTEWVNVAKARPLFKGHYQPKIPADLGFYDLRMPEVREKQAELARSAGIEGFCYWHYYFGNGRRLLEHPFNEVLNSGRPDFPFCLGWANHSWTNKTWHAGKKFAKDGMLMEQLYPGAEDYKNHFNLLFPAFTDKRYITVDGKPLFLVYEPHEIPDPQVFIKTWRELALKKGMKGIHFVGISNSMSSLVVEEKQGKKKYRLSKMSDPSAPYYKSILDLGFDAVNSRGQRRAEILVNGLLKKNLYRILNEKLKIGIVDKYNYQDLIDYLFVEEDKWVNVYPTAIPNWDRSARSGKKALIWHNSTPELFDQHFKKALDIVKNKDNEHKIIFLKSWNEWGEGNYVEPCIKYGRGYLDVIKKNLTS